MNKKRMVSAFWLCCCFVFAVLAHAYAATPFEEKDIYIIGDSYLSKYGNVVSIKIENGKVTVTKTKPDGSQEIITETPEEFENKDAKDAKDSKDPKTKTKVRKIEIGTVEVNTSLNVRTSPWGNIVDSFRGGDKVKIVDRVGVWYRIVHNGKIAFIHANYVSVPGAPAGQVPVIYPWQMDSHKKGGEVAATPATPAKASGSTGGSGAFGAAPCQPMPTRVSSEYGMRMHPIQKVRKMHNGIDLPVPNGTRLNALGDGTVTDVGYGSGAGRYVKIRYDNGLESFYCHNKSHSVKKGQRVSKGQEVARSDNTGGSTGPHLHFGIKKNGKWVNPRSVGVPLP